MSALLQRRKERAVYLMAIGCSQEEIAEALAVPLGDVIETLKRLCREDEAFDRATDVIIAGRKLSEAVSVARDLRRSGVRSVIIQEDHTHGRPL